MHISKPRVSAHNLQIETGRFRKSKTPRDERFCPYCKTLNIFTVEDEVHFLLACPLFNKEHQKFLEGIHRAFHPTASLNDFNMHI